ERSGHPKHRLIDKDHPHYPDILSLRQNCPTFASVSGSWSLLDGMSAIATGSFLAEPNRSSYLFTAFPPGIPCACPSPRSIVTWTPPAARRCVRASCSSCWPGGGCGGAVTPEGIRWYDGAEGGCQMSAPPLVSDEEVYSLSPAELRFREACQFYALFKRYHGPDAGLKGNRFLWMCYVDAFLTAIVSVKDLTSLRSQLNASDAFRFIVVMRNITAHQAVVSVASSVSMVVRDIHVQAGAHNPDRPDHEMPILAASKIATALTNYEAQLRAQDVRTNKHTGKTTSMWDREGGNVRGALRWNAKLAALPEPRVPLSDAFLEVINFVAKVCGFI